MVSLLVYKRSYIAQAVVKFVASWHPPCWVCWIARTVGTCLDTLLFKKWSDRNQQFQCWGRKRPLEMAHCKRVCLPAQPLFRCKAVHSFEPRMFLEPLHPDVPSSAHFDWLSFILISNSFVLCLCFCYFIDGLFYSWYVDSVLQD